MKNLFRGSRRRSPNRKRNYQGDKKESMSVSRQFSDWNNWGANWNLIDKWLESKVGQPWGQVYSDLCVILRQQDKVNHRIKDCILKWVVSPYGEIINGQLVDEKGERISSYRGPTFYVDKDGILKVHYQKRTKKKSKLINEFILDKEHSYKSHKGLWYWVRYAPVKRWSTLHNIYIYDYYDVLIKGLAPSRATKRVVEKRPVTKKELKMIKLWLAQQSV